MQNVGQNVGQNVDLTALSIQDCIFLQLSRKHQLLNNK